jgi:hypothetical protein
MEPPKIEDIPTLCYKAIATIMSKANRKIAEIFRKKEYSLYKKSPRRYHHNLKTTAGLQTKAKDQLNLVMIRDPRTNEILAELNQILNILKTYFEKKIFLQHTGIHTSLPKALPPEFSSLYQK